MNSFLFLAIIASFLLATQFVDAFVPKRNALVQQTKVSNSALLACRRNNKKEKRLRNRENARKYMRPGGVPRKKLVVEMKRGVIARSEEAFMAKVFQYTTDADMPVYTGFDFV